MTSYEYWREQLAVPETTEQLTHRLRQGKAGDTLDFLTYLVSMDELKAATAQSYRTAVDQVLTAAGRTRLYEDVRKLDDDRCVALFHQHRDDLGDGTRSTYEGRFRRSVGLYRDWLEDPDQFQGPATRQFVQNVFVGHGRGNPLQFRNLNEVISAALQQTDEDSLVPYVYSLRDGRTTFFLLPSPLSSGDVEQLSAYVLSLRVDPVADLPRGGHKAPADAGRAKEPEGEDA